VAVAARRVVTAAEHSLWKGRYLAASDMPETHLIHYHRALGAQRRRLGTRFMGHPNRIGFEPVLVGTAGSSVFVVP
jgi:hypothetical protein